MEELTSFRPCGHEGVDELLWVTKDKGAFGNEQDGPLYDWLEGREYFLEKVKKFDTVVQAGGNCGMYPRFYRNYFKEVLTFEPDVLNYYCLSYNCQGEGFRTFNGGLGNTRKSLSMKLGPESNVGMHTIREVPGDIKMYRLDDIPLLTCDLIHLDVEGYEDKALQGAINTIERFSPVIITERAGGKDFLESLGYVVYKKLRMDTIFVRIK